MFPDTPAVNETVVVGRRVWIWDGDKWLQMPFSTTQLGIGSEMPTYALDVDGDINLTGVYRINGVPLSFGAAQTPWLSNINANNYFLNSAGAIGIQQTATSAIPLSISTRPAATNSAIVINSNDGLGIAGISMRDLAGSNTQCGFEFGPPGYAGPWDSKCGIYATSAIDIVFAGASGPNAPLTELMHITAAGLVGINNPAPGFTLDVTGDCNISGTYRVNGVPLSTGGGSQTPWLSDINGAGHALNNASGIGINVTAAPAQTPLSIGTVGLATTPTVQLAASDEDAIVAISLLDSTNSIRAGLTVANVQNSEAPSAFVGVAALYFSNNFAFLNAATPSDFSAVERMRITSSGNVGIGTASPGAMLDVNGFMRSTNVTSVPTSGVGLELFYTPANNFASVGLTDRSAGSYTGHLALDGAITCINAFSLGNVGIGTTSPAYRLDVAGDCNISGTYRVNGVPIGALQFVRQSAPIGVTTAWQNLPGATLTLAAAGRYLITAVFDFVNAGDQNGILFGQLVAGGVAQSQVAIMSVQPTAVAIGEATVTQQWDYLAAAGAVLTLQAINFGSGSGATRCDVQTTLTALWVSAS